MSNKHVVKLTSSHGHKTYLRVTEEPEAMKVWVTAFLETLLKDGGFVIENDEHTIEVSENGTIWKSFDWFYLDGSNLMTMEIVQSEGQRVQPKSK